MRCYTIIQRHVILPYIRYEVIEETPVVRIGGGEETGFLLISPKLYEITKKNQKVYWCTTQEHTEPPVIELLPGAGIDNYALICVKDCSYAYGQCDFRCTDNAQPLMCKEISNGRAELVISMPPKSAIIVATTGQAAFGDILTAKYVWNGRDLKRIVLRKAYKSAFIHNMFLPDDVRV